MRRSLLPWVLVLGVLAAGCGGGAPTQASGAAESLTLRLTTAHFRLEADRASAPVLQEVADRLEAEHGRILAELQVGSVRTVTVQVWQDEASYSAALRAYFGRSYSAVGYITGPDMLRLLAVSAVARNAVHEFCHAVSLYLNPSLANNPRWLWETVALYENGELVDPRTQADLVRGDFPTLAQLNADPSASQRIYQVGYLIGDFVVARWGRPTLLQLVRTNGDEPGTLGMSVAEFEAAWAAFVRQRYLTP